MRTGLLLVAVLFPVLAGSPTRRPGDGGTPQPGGAQRYRSMSLALEPRTTAGDIAAANLESELAFVTRRLERQPHDLALLARAAALDLARARFLGTVADYAHADQLAARLLAEGADEEASWLMRARVSASLHRFDQALEELACARALAAGPRQDDAPALDLEASILEARGLLDEALDRRVALAAMAPSTATWGALAGVHVARGERDLAAAAFAEARRAYHNVTPFPLAWLDLEEATMAREAGDRERSRELLERALARLPRFVRATVLLAELEEADGRPERAIELLLPLAGKSDDPEVAGHLARLLAARAPERARTMRQTAAVQFERLLAAHPEAFADHAAEFWLGAGGNPGRAFGLAELNHRVRRTPASAALLERARAAAAM